ncbi:intermembrane phospholipid transport protein YdbH family protein [Sphingomonas solaris]|uniref:Uncharacterized protein n=1 Tax=Alterirhizorhabdus solaris TaxID=2529389 RepID=A0A558R825_9SPHN|nr:YdbH domain-containing protein [Sphingomonas solaris]TVV75478.1 hypothetical protein FOY91_07065 [Sphingomonas solaris]
MDEETVRRPRRWRKAVAVLVAVLLLALLGLWSQRKPIARGIVDRELRARNVPARYRIADLGPGVQRLTNVVIGDPASPDLTADELVLRLRYGLGLPTVGTIEGRGVRLRGRLVEGKLSFGAIDRLLPASDGAPFNLPDVAVDLADARIRVESAFGAVDLGVSGAGNLADGFVGRVVANAPRLASGDCTARAVSATLAVRIEDRQPRLSGPLGTESLRCAGITLERPRIDLATVLAPDLAPRTAQATFVGGRLAHGSEQVGAVRGRISYDATDPRDRHGRLELAGQALRTRYGTARAFRWQGPYRIGAAVGPGGVRPLRASGDLAIDGADILATRVAGDHARALAGSPLEPIGQALAGAIVAAGRDANLTARLAFDGDIGGRAAPIAGEVQASAIGLASRSGARIAFGGGAGLTVATTGGTRLDGLVTTGGGGLPAARVILKQAAAGASMSGTATVAPYTVDGARLALAPSRFSLEGGRLRLATVATIDGPLGDGRVRGLTLPLAATFEKTLRVNEACVPLTFASLSIAGMDLGATRLPLCPVGGAMLRVANGRLTGGMAVPRPRLAGRVGSQPLTIAAADLRVDVARAGFTADTVAIRLGGENGTRLDLARLDGRTGPGGIAGRFTGAAGAIAKVPLLLSGGEGTWRLAQGRLGIEARATVADADANPRFVPLVAHDIALKLTGGLIRVTGTLRLPSNNVPVTNVAIIHDLHDGQGHATLDVPGLTFGPAFQPEMLTRLTLGVVANVSGTVAGKGRIDWNREGVTSTGDFATDGIDLAAVFGPVTGIRGKIHFSDLLGLVTPPGQLVTVASFNPGIAVEGGVIGYQLLPGLKVAVGGGKWPFSGGSLILEPTVLDFGQPVERRMTFRVEGMQAGAFISRFEFKNIEATGVFDGTLPMIFDERGGRISGGRLVVRKGGGTLAYVGELTNEDLGMFGKLAFDALKAIRYDNLAIELDGALDSEIVSRILFTGINENPAPGKEAKGLLKNLTGLPFRFNIVIRAPFRGLTSSAEAFANPGSLLGDAVAPAVPADTPAAPAVQPPLSEDKR